MLSDSKPEGTIQCATVQTLPGWCHPAEQWSIRQSQWDPSQLPLWKSDGKQLGQGEGSGVTYSIQQPEQQSVKPQLGLASTGAQIGARQAAPQQLPAMNSIARRPLGSTVFSLRTRHPVPLSEGEHHPCVGFVHRE